MASETCGWRKTKDKDNIDHEKLDNFIELVLSKYTFQSPDDKLYQIAGEQAYNIINNNSLTPDLVIYNKAFNKNLCFYDFKGNSFNPFPRKKFKFEFRGNDDKKQKDIGSNYSNEDDIQWADADINELEKDQFAFCKLPGQLEKQGDNIDDILDFKNDDLEEELIMKEIEHEEEEKNIINNFDLNIFNSEVPKETKDASNNESSNINNEFDMGFLTQMAQNVYGMKIEDNESQENYSRDGESIKDKFGLKSILGDDGESESLNNSIMKPNDIIENKENSLIKTNISKSETPLKPEPVKTNLNSKAYVPKNLVFTDSNQADKGNTTKNNKAIPGFPIFPPQFMNFMSNYMNNMQQNNSNSKKESVNEKPTKESKASFDIIDDPINIIYKNLFEKGWFVQVNDRKMINFNSYELLEFMEIHSKSGKDLYDLSITDYHTDMYFNPPTLLENLRDVITQFKASMALQIHMSKMNQSKFPAPKTNKK